MEEIFNKLQNEPIALIAIAGLAIGIAFLFLIPAFINYIRSFHLPVLRSKDEESQEPAEVEEEEIKEMTKEAEVPQEQEVPKKTSAAGSVVSKIQMPTIGFQRPSFKLGFKFRPSKYIILGLIGVILVGAAIFSVDFFLRPVRMMDAWQLKLEKGEQLTKLQTGGLGSWPDAKIYLIDARSRESYQKGHLRGADNVPSYKAVDFYPIDGIAIVIYSSEFSLREARAVADTIEENGKSGRISYEKPGQIFVVKDGYEGLEKAGFEIESGEKK